MPTKATTVADYLAALPADRRAALLQVREVILRNLDKDYEEGISYGMIGYQVPHRVFPAGYHCNPEQPLPFAGLAAQKSHLSLYLMGLYFDGAGGLLDWFREAWLATGKKLDMGKSCIRFRRIEDLPLDVIGEAVRRMPVQWYVDLYTRTLAARSGATRGRTAGNRKKTAAKKPATAKTANRKARTNAR